MVIIGMSFYNNRNNEKVYTLYVEEPFDAYFTSEDGSRNCVGKKTDSIFVGNYDCSALKPGMEIDISYERAVSTKNGSFQPIKKIEIVSDGQSVQRPAVRQAVKPQIQQEQ